MARFHQIFSFACLLALLLQTAWGEAATVKKPPAVKDPAVQPMLFAVVRSGITGCEPNCPQWISAEGQIMPGSAAQFRKVLKQAGKMRLPVIITSSGGDVEAALAMGRMIRERKLDVVVGWTLFTGCNPSVKTCKLPKEQNGVYAGLAMTSRGYCFSACPFVVAAGQKRMLGTGAILGVHEITTQPITQRIRYNETYTIVNGKKKVLSRQVVSRKNIIGKVTTKLSKPFDRKLRAYLTTMGVDLVLLDLLHLAPPSSIHNLTFDELKSTSLVTAFGNATELVSNSLCRTTPPADNCKEEKNFVAALPPPPVPSNAFQPARFPSGPDMTFSIVRSSLAGCEPLCPEWIFADGKIAAETPALFKKILARTGKRPLPLVIRSDGGDAVAAMDMGRIIKARKRDVIVASTLFAGCPMSEPQCRQAEGAKGRARGAIIRHKDTCNAACVLVLAAGQNRIMESRAAIGVGRLGSENQPEGGAVVKVSALQNRDEEFQQSLGKYLDEMGVGRELLALMEKFRHLALYSLSGDELTKTGLITKRLTDLELLTNTSCKASPAAENCVKR